MVVGGPQQQTNDLAKLARSRFGRSSEAGLRLSRATPKGEVAWCGPSAISLVKRKGCLLPQGGALTYCVSTF